MTIAKWIDQGVLPGHTTPGGHRRVKSSDLVRFLNKHGMPVPTGLGGGEHRVLAVHRDVAGGRGRPLVPVLGPLPVKGDDPVGIDIQHRFPSHSTAIPFGGDFSGILQGSWQINAWQAPHDGLDNAPQTHPDAGWSSLVARQAHNLKVVGSNPTPATN